MIMRIWTTLLFLSFTISLFGQGSKLSPVNSTIVNSVSSNAELIKQTNQAIWKLAEVGLEERQSSALLQHHLSQAGFKVEKGISKMPTAFVASYGSGHPIIGILAEYDALPGLSQQVADHQTPVTEGGNGHGCGHSGLGAGALGAALAIKSAMDKHDLKGTIRLYGTPAEETVIGKVYMTLDGVFDDLDVCLHWHPGDKNNTYAGSSKALVSAKFTFDGTAAHAAGSPEDGRSALDAVELMNVGANFMREHIKEDARLHYVITNGGGAPNVVPPKATVWYFCRADRHEDVEYNFKWLKDIAKGASLMTRTRLTVQVDTDCHEIIPNIALSRQLVKNMQLIGAPEFTQEEENFARKLQAPLVAQFGREYPLALDGRVHPVTQNPESSKGSTDVGDISWRVPTSGIRATCFIADAPGHSWQNVSSIGSSIGEKGILFASKVLATTAVELMQNPKQVLAAKAEWQQRMEGKKYFTFIPEGQSVPKSIR
tara:strand:- start:5817 stop:7271 length:1455 start_codon:yes stop_codon:yes gene_type:complete